MRAKITKIEEPKGSFQGGKFRYVFLKTEEGQPVKTCIHQRFGNALRWEREIPKWKDALASGQEVWLDGLILRGLLVDADSFFKVEKPVEKQPL